MSTLQQRRNNQSRKTSTGNRTSTALSMQILLPLLLSITLILALATQAAEASFSVIMRVKDVNSNSPTVKAVVKTDTGLKLSRTVDLGDKANKADLDMVDLHFFFSNDKQTKIGTGFKACLDGQCKSGTNGPTHKPEVVTFTAKKVN